MQVWIVTIFTWWMKFTWVSGTLEGQWNAQVKAWVVLAGPDTTRWWASWTMRSRGPARVDKFAEEFVERFLELESARWWVWAGSISASYVANIDPDWLLDRKSKNSEISTTPPCFTCFIKEALKTSQVELKIQPKYKSVEVWIVNPGLWIVTWWSQSLECLNNKPLFLLFLV